ncbi:hypothetical protein [Acinetobacter phage AB1I1M-1]
MKQFIKDLKFIAIASIIIFLVFINCTSVAASIVALLISAFIMATCSYITNGVHSELFDSEIF